MSSFVEIVDYSSAHLDQSLVLSKKLNWPHRRDDWNMIHELSFGKAAVAEGNLVGTGFRTDFGPHISSINMIIVAESARRKGIGMRIMSALMAGGEQQTYRLITTLIGKAR